MKTILKRFVAGAILTILASAFSACSPMVVAPSHPRPIVYAPAPPSVQQVLITPVVPVWAPPYTYVTEVHYYYFPDYMVYYDVFDQSYCYSDGYNWLHVTVLPSIPLYYGFSPYNAYIIVLNHSVYQPWVRHDYYEQQYPTGYYKTMYSPRTAIGTNTVLRAYDENQSRPVFVDKRSNKEVAVKYDVRPSRIEVKNNATKVDPSSTKSQIKIPGSDSHETIGIRSDKATKNVAVPETKNGSSNQQHSEMNFPSGNIAKKNDSREANINAIEKNRVDIPSNIKSTPKSNNRSIDPKPVKDIKSKDAKQNVEKGNANRINDSKNLVKEKSSSLRSK